MPCQAEESIWRHLKEMVSSWSYIHREKMTKNGVVSEGITWKRVGASQKLGGPIDPRPGRLNHRRWLSHAQNLRYLCRDQWRVALSGWSALGWVRSRAMRLPRISATALNSTKLPPSNQINVIFNRKNTINKKFLNTWKINRRERASSSCSVVLSTCQIQKKQKRRRVIKQICSRLRNK